MKFLYTAVQAFGQDYDEDGLSWVRYCNWKGHRTEVVTLDGWLNKSLIEFPGNWDYVYFSDQGPISYFTNLDYVVQQVKGKDRFNLLTIAIEPDQDCKDIAVDGFEFVGYDLMDQPYFDISSLTNCDGFNDPILPTDSNQFGLIDDFKRAYELKKRLLETNPDHPHANTAVVAVWRHKTIGRQKEQ